MLTIVTSFKMGDTCGLPHSQKNVLTKRQFVPHNKVEVQILVTVNMYQQCDRWLWDFAICSAN